MTRQVTLLDYGAGNVRSVTNALRRLGCKVVVVRDGADILAAERVVFPGVGEFGSILRALRDKGWVEPLREYLASNRPFLGICVGLQALFDGSDESPDVPGLGFLRGRVRKFRTSLSIPHIGWNGLRGARASRLFAGLSGEEKFYFVHSYHVVPDERAAILASTDYGQEFTSAIEVGNVVGTQFHPEKSGEAGLRLLKNFVDWENHAPAALAERTGPTELAKRIIACLDVRANDAGDLVVTKGDRYDVREKGAGGEKEHGGRKGAVRNLGKPVDLARRYYAEDADEITFLNITGFRDFPLKDMPMLEVLRQTSENVFVPLTIGGGIRDYQDQSGKRYSALEVAHEYFRSGADKISIGSDAVLIVEAYLASRMKTGSSSIEQIARVYGNQAVVVSIDPRRVYVKSPADTPHHTIPTDRPGPAGERFCWYQCTAKGAREGRDLDAVTLAKACEDLGTGEILLNCIDRDGTNQGFDLELIRAVSDAVGIPVIASSGAGRVEHFSEVFRETHAEAALAAGIFHRREVPIGDVKDHLGRVGIEVRRGRSSVPR